MSSGTGSPLGALVEPGMVKKAGRPRSVGHLVSPGIVFYSEPDRVAAGVQAVLIRIPQAISATTIFLLVKFLILGNFYHAVGPAALAPVVRPVGEAVILAGGTNTTAVDLVNVFPARCAEGAGKDLEAVLFGIEGRAFKPHVKAECATVAPLWLHFIPLCALEPVVPVIIEVHKRHF